MILPRLHGQPGTLHSAADIAKTLPRRGFKGQPLLLERDPAQASLTWLCCQTQFCQVFEGQLMSWVCRGVSDQNLRRLVSHGSEPEVLRPKFKTSGSSLCLKPEAQMPAESQCHTATL